MDVLLFGDQTVDSSASLRRLLTGKQGSLLTDFLNRAFSRLQSENSRQARPHRCVELERSSGWDEFLANRYVAGKSTSIESALCSLTQLACWIKQSEDVTNSSQDRLSRPLTILGVCTGLLAASAVASINSTGSITALIPLAVEVVAIAFRTGALVGTLSSQLEAEGSSSRSWSTSVGLSSDAIQNAIAEFNQNCSLPATNRIYLSAIGSKQSVTVSGPPSSRQRFLASSALQGVRRLDVPILGPYHASHLYQESHVDHILTAETRQLLQRYKVSHPIYSTKTGSLFEAKDLETLIAQCLEQILIEIVDWDSVVSNVSKDVLASGQACHIFPVGPTNLSHSLLTALKDTGVADLSIEDQHAQFNNDLGARKGDDAKIAICGMAGRFPDAANHELFWQLLEKGLDVHKEVPKERFDAQAHYDPSGKKRNASHTPYGCFIDNPGLFDPRFFNMSPREAAQTDPMQRLALTTAYEAMEMAGFVSNRTPSSQAHRVGTFYGQTSDDWREVNAAQNIDTYFITGGIRAFGPGRINYHFKFSGPSFGIDTACSSSLAAIQLACSELLNKNCDTAFAGGLNVMTNPDFFSGLSKGQFLSKTGSCKTFDNGADGYCRGDGVATVILKRLDDAIADKDPILAVIRGCNTNHSAEAVSITHPHAGAQEFLFRNVLASSGIEPTAVDYVEMHGTGTQAGDGIEMTSVSNVFAPRLPKRPSDKPLYLGAVKSNIGHGEASSGITALIKVLMMLKKNAIPPHCGIKSQINQTFPKDLRERGVNIAMQKTSFPRPAGGKRTVFLNNFSAAGGNTALLLEDAPEPKFIEASDPRHGVIAVSAKSAKSLKMNIQRLHDFLNGESDAILPSLSYTTTARRAHYPFRVAFAAADLASARTSLAKLVEAEHKAIANVSSKIAFVFTGQGSQYPALGKQLFQTSSTFKATLEQCDEIVRSQGFPSFFPLVDGSVEDLTTLSPVVIQLGMVCIQIALAQLWKAWGIQPSVVIGHSLGEYAALAVSGAVSMAETLFLVGNRARLLEEKCTAGTHMMLAVKATSKAATEAIEGLQAEVACINGLSDTVVAGTVDAVNAAAEKFTAMGVKSTRVNVPFAFHSAQVEPILEAYEKAAQSVSFKAPTIPLISPLLATVIADGETINAKYVARHCREAVDFAGGLTTALEQGLVDAKTSFIEIGPHPVCSGMVRSTLGSEYIGLPSLRRNEEPWKTIPTSVAALHAKGVAFDWQEYHREFEDAVEVIQLPSYAFDEKNYWIEYTNNWTLTKGDKAVAEEVVEIEKPKLSTTTVQKIYKEEVNGGVALAIGESNIGDPLLHSTICGHLVNGAGLCPSSVYGDMAFTIADYAYKLLRPNVEKVDMNIDHLEAFRPLLVRNIDKPEDQIVRIEASATLESAKVAIYSISADGKTRTDHSKCTVHYEDSAKWSMEWQRTAYLIQSRIDILKQKMREGEANRIMRGMAYKLFAALVKYDTKFQGMKEVILDSEKLEAMAEIKLLATEKDGKFFFSPYFIDSVAHLSGFIMNANDAVDSKNFVYISHGWESMRFSCALETTKTYTTYVKMHPAAGNSVAGDLYVFDGDQVIGLVGGLKFQRIPRTLLDTLLKPSGSPVSKPVATPPQRSRRSTIRESRSRGASVVEKPAPVLKQPSRPSGIVQQAINIIVDEVGVDAAEITDDLDFNQIGVDSLMTLAISSKFREELHIEVDSHLFTVYPTVGSLKAYLAKFDTGATVEFERPETPEIQSRNPSVFSSPSDTPSSGTRMSSPARSMPDMDECDDIESSGLSNTLRSTIAAEMGIDIEEIAGDTDLSTLGMDSLMSLGILSILREKTGLPLEPEFLHENTSIDKMETALGLNKPKKAAPPRRASKSAPRPPASSVLLQGNPSTATKNIFMFPDGSGSATSYVQIPQLAANDVCLYGMNCPFLKTPEDYTCGIDGVATLYMTELRRRQPHGPYFLGGWSAGGVIAYEITRQLLEQGETVEQLYLIDSPNPLHLQPTPLRLHHWLNEIGLLGDGNAANTPPWLLEHFRASVANLGSYEAKPLGQSISPRTPFPKVLAIWAKYGVAKNPEDPRPEIQNGDPNSMSWIVENRPAFDLNGGGWQELVGEGLVNQSVEANHFTMMRKPVVDDIGRILKSFLF